ncbi:hypothetical protein ACA910_017576 [Epithemia clementina (nom. ined.)]
MPAFLDWWRRRQAPKEDGNRKERRYQTIEGWLITKRIQPHGKECEMIRNKFCRPCNDGSGTPCSPVKAVSSFDSSDTVHTSSDSEAEEGEYKECPICMEPFSVDDIVSWSPNIDGTCKHVFHHECIKEWMLQSGNCPCCRELILPIDQEGHSLERPVLKELCKKRAKLAATSYYCLVDGFVCFDPPGKCNMEMFVALKSITACRLVPEDVSSRRGHRMLCGIEQEEEEAIIENDTQSHDDDGEDEEEQQQAPLSPCHISRNVDVEDPFQSSIEEEDDDDDSIDVTKRSVRPLILQNSQTSSSHSPQSTTSAASTGSRLEEGIF